MNWDEMTDAVTDAKNTIRLGDLAAKRACELLPGRLRSAKIPGHILEKLKRELKDFNMQTFQWKDKK